MDRRKLNRILWVFMALMFIAVALMLMSNLRRTTHITLPEEIVTENSDTQGGAAASDMLTVVEVVPETVQAAVETLSRPKSYRRAVTVEQIWSSGEAKTELTVSVLDDWTRVDRVLPDGQIRHTLTDGSTTYIWYNEEKRLFSNISGEISADNEQMIPTYEDILDVSPEDISTADYREYEEIPCIYVETCPNVYGYSYRYWVSVDTGLLVAAERMTDGTCVYRMIALTLDSVPPVESDFVLPDGKSVLST